MSRGDRSEACSEVTQLSVLRRGLSELQHLTSRVDNVASLCLCGQLKSLTSFVVDLVGPMVESCFKSFGAWKLAPEEKPVRRSVKSSAQKGL